MIGDCLLAIDVLASEYGGARSWHLWRLRPFRKLTQVFL
jgi:hypothetical protein